MTQCIPGFHHWRESTFAGRPTAVAMGIFDGVHLGHQALLGSLRQWAHDHQVPSVVLTFEPHPAKVLRPAYAPLLLEPIDARVRHMQRLGVDAVVVHPFDRATAGLVAAEFVRDVLHQTFRAQSIFVGSDFVFGHKQGGDVPLLRAMGETLGFVVNPHPQVRVAGMVASSTKIREFVRRGALQGAADLLGRPYGLYCRATSQGQAGAEAVPQGPWQAFAPVAEQVPAPGLYAAYAASSEHRAGSLVHIAHNNDDDDRGARVYAHPLSGQELLPEGVEQLILLQRLHAAPSLQHPAHKAPHGQDIAAAKQAVAAAELYTLY